METMFARLKADLITARKASDRDSVTTLSTLIGELSRARDKGEPSDAHVFSTLTRFEASILETLKVQANPQLDKELVLIRALLAHKPAPVTEAEMVELVERFVAEDPANASIKTLMPRLKQELGLRVS